MDSRNTSEGNISPTAMPNGRQNRSQASTPTMPLFPVWSGAVLSPGLGITTDPWASMPNSATFRAGATEFQPVGTGLEGSTRMRWLSNGSIADDCDDLPVIVSSTPAVQQPVGTKSSSASSSPVQPREWFTTDVDPDKPRREGLSGHFLQIQGVKKSELSDGFIKFLEEEYTTGIRGKKYLNASEHAESIDVVLFIDDTCTAEEITVNLASQAHVTTSFVSFDWYQNGRAAPDRTSIEPVSMYVGQVTLTVSFKGCTDDFDNNNPVDLHSKVRAFAASFGEVLAFEKTRGVTYPDHQFRVEFYKASVAADAIEQGAAGKQLPEVPGWTVTVSQYLPPTHGTPVQHMPAEHHAVQPVLPPPGVQVTTSPTGRTAWWTDDKGVTHPCPPPRALAVVPRDIYEPVNAQLFDEAFPASPVSPRAMVPYTGGHASIDSVVNGNDSPVWKDPREKAAQVVSLDRIVAGLDVRTTIMMRNVPNSWTRSKLKEKVDLHCRNRYNFMYLRIDFTAGKNVGYAFVNFETANDIVPFLQNMVGKTWEGGPLHQHKPKLVEVSYATIQGMDSLIDKFRNSSIMDENAEYRPALLQTREEHMKDQQEAINMSRQGMQPAPITPVGEFKPFPAVNNRAKKERSTANAGQIGLFSPRNHRQNHERFRRSQFDRGTPAQLAEEYQNALVPYSPVTAMPPFSPGRVGNLYPPTMHPGVPFIGSPPPFNRNWSFGPPVWPETPYQPVGMPSPGSQLFGRRAASNGDYHVVNGSPRPANGRMSPRIGPVSPRNGHNGHVNGN